jgi:hypothetical protein
MKHVPKCSICGAKNAPRGYGYGGARADRKSQAVLWACTSQSCLDAAEMRWRAANDPAGRAASQARDADVQPQARRGGAVRSGSHDTQQGALDL